jgi:phage-related protein
MKGIKFDETHSYYDLNLILSDCSISPAKPKENFIDIPGADGSLDLTEALGTVKFSDRTGKLIFSVLPSDDFEEKKSEVANFLNGQKFKITLDKDPDFYYIGRCSINDHKCDKRVGTITVDLKLQPWKLKQELTVLATTLSNSGQNELKILFRLQNLRKPTKVTVECNKDIRIEQNDNVYSFTAGSWVLENPLVEGVNYIYVCYSSNINIRFSYQEGCL